MIRLNKKILEIKGLTKRFPNVLAVNNIDLDLRKGEIQTLLGENGAGKTTLVKCVYGLQRPESGEIFIKGEKIKISSPRDAISHGIGLVQQEFSLIPNLTVLQNVILNASDDLVIDFNKEKEKLKKLSQKYKLKVDPERNVEDLSVGEQQRTEILRTLARDVEILILDEPTALLTLGEVDALLDSIKNISSKGKSIIFITHKLDEALEISDRISVLRNGEKVGTFKVEEVNRKKLAKLMVGRGVMFDIEGRKKEIGEPVLKVDKLSVKGRTERSSLHEVSFEVRKGEIYGILGVSGNGQTELFEALTGLREIQTGDFYVNEKNLKDKDPAEIIDSGVAAIPEDREKVGIALEESVSDNLILKRQDDTEFRGNLFLKKGNIRDYCSGLISSFDIRTPDMDQPCRSLSGGNIQRVIVGREFSLNHELIIAHNPTRGLDVSLQEELRKKLIKEANNGKAVLLISNDIKEVIMMTDRFGVISDGAISEEIMPEEATAEKIGSLMGE
ncbi:hypothetical protein AKJ37_03255 [candidate division MSBL1 archaeon SCGC-AAA259I09]|uniref:ABC transporter domain-containing protein n=1 Tax=candidate division MSBL1 archaeon SCGC-AAA259I09 TaxID=1698267 RepID=A0A133UT45_9EURY|nr:hypothetical protein AKJ37_03255 [candidate division MSBL1 archaeon SCGC-AAA259I09]